MIINRRVFNFCKNYHKLTGQLPGQTNPDIKERLDNFKKLYKPVDPVYLKEQELKQLREKVIQENLEYSQEEQQVIESKNNNYLKFMGIFCAGMFVYLLKETYIFYTNPKNVILYDENTGKTYQTTKEEFEKIKQESKKNREYKEFRIKVLSKQQAEQLQQQVRQKNKEAAKEDGLI